MASQLGRWEEQGVSVVKKERINGEELPGRSWYKIRAAAQLPFGALVPGRVQNRLVDPLEEVCQMTRRKPIVPLRPCRSSVLN